MNNGNTFAIEIELFLLINAAVSFIKTFLYYPGLGDGICCCEHLGGGVGMSCTALQCLAFALLALEAPPLLTCNHGFSCPCFLS